MAEYTKPVPRSETPMINEVFWDAAKRHELLIPRCRKCNSFFWYPRPACPTCWEEDWEWVAVKGTGRVHTYTIVRQPQNPAFNDDVPYVYAIIQLDEGVRMISNVIKCNVPDGVKVDMRVKVVFDDVTPEWSLPKFEPA